MRIVRLWALRSLRPLIRCFLRWFRRIDVCRVVLLRGMGLVRVCRGAVYANVLGGELRFLRRFLEEVQTLGSRILLCFWRVLLILGVLEGFVLLLSLLVDLLRVLLVSKVWSS